MAAPTFLFDELDEIAEDEDVGIFVNSVMTLNSKDGMVELDVDEFVDIFRELVLALDNHPEYYQAVVVRYLTNDFNNVEDDYANVMGKAVDEVLETARHLSEVQRQYLNALRDDKELLGIFFGCLLEGANMIRDEAPSGKCWN